MLSLAYILILCCMSVALFNNIAIGARDRQIRLFRAAQEVAAGRETATSAARGTGLTGRQTVDVAEVQDEVRRQRAAEETRRKGTTFRGGRQGSNVEIKFFDIRGNPVRGRIDTKVSVPRGFTANPGANVKGQVAKSVPQAVQERLLRASGFSISRQQGVTVAKKSNRQIFISQGRVLADLPTSATFDLSRTIQLQRQREAKRKKAVAPKPVIEISKTKIKPTTKFEKFVTVVTKEETRLARAREARLEKFKKIPGLKGEAFLQKVGREIIDLPRGFTIGLGETLGITLAKATIPVIATFIPSKRKFVLPTLKEAARLTPGAVGQSLDPRTASGLVNFLATAGFIGVGLRGGSAGRKSSAVSAKRNTIKKGIQEVKSDVKGVTTKQSGSFTSNTGSKLKFIVDTFTPSNKKVGSFKVVLKDKQGKVVLRKIGKTVLKTKLKPSVAKKITSLTQGITSQKKLISNKISSVNKGFRQFNVRLRVVGLRTRLTLTKFAQLQRLVLLRRLDPLITSLRKSKGKITKPVKQQLDKVNKFFKEIQQKIEVAEAKDVTTKFFKPSIDISKSLQLKIRNLRNKIRKKIELAEKDVAFADLDVRLQLTQKRVSGSIKLVNERILNKINNELDVVRSITRDLKAVKNLIVKNKTAALIKRRDSLIIRLRQKINPLRSTLNNIGFKVELIKKRLKPISKKFRKIKEEVLLRLREGQRLETDFGFIVTPPKKLKSITRDFKQRFNTRLRLLKIDLRRSKKVVTRPILKRISLLNKQLSFIGSEIKFRVDKKTGKLLNKAGRIISKVSPVEISISRLGVQKRIGKVSLKQRRTRERKRSLIRAQNKQLLKDIKEGIVPLKASTSSRIRKALRKQILAKDSINPLKIPKGFFDKKFIGESNVVRKLRRKQFVRETNIRARDQLVKELISNPGSLNNLNVRASIRKLLRKKIIGKRSIAPLKIPEAAFVSEIRIFRNIQTEVKKKINPFSPEQRLKQIAALNKVDRRIQRFSEAKDKGGKSTVLLLQTKKKQLNKQKSIVQSKTSQIFKQERIIKQRLKTKLESKTKGKLRFLLRTIQTEKSHLKNIIIILTKQVNKLTSLVKQTPVIDVVSKLGAPAKIKKVVKLRRRVVSASKFKAAQIFKQKLVLRKKLIRGVIVKIKREVKVKEKKLRRRGVVKRKFVFSPDIAALLNNVKATPKERRLLLKKGRIFTGLEQRKRV